MPLFVQELVRAKLDECPRLQYVASQSWVRGGESVRGAGYGPMCQVTRYAFSTAFLVTEGFKDQDSLASHDPVEVHRHYRWV